jgi:hypothetical protein
MASDLVLLSPRKRGDRDEPTAISGRSAAGVRAPPRPRKASVGPPASGGTEGGLPCRAEGLKVVRLKGLDPEFEPTRDLANCF